MTARVKLCAIARDEGPYVADWLFHHLHFGFDAIEVWVNGTEDATGRIVKAISATHPQVMRRNADRFMEACLREGRHFQIHLYRRLVGRARREGFTHIAFLDLDEYWTPRDFASPIQTFLPRDDAPVNVVSFPWALDVPDQTRQPFERPFARPPTVQMHNHVKSVGRLDDTSLKAHVHTFKTESGERLLVRQPFPLTGAKWQKHGSMVTTEHWQDHWHELPEAFVLHAINRSETEYLATIAKGQRQSGLDSEFKTNRKGYLPTRSPILTFTPPARARRRYLRRRDAFQRQHHLDRMIRRSERLLLRRAEALRTRLDDDAGLRDHLAHALAGTSIADRDVAAASPSP